MNLMSSRVLGAAAVLASPALWQGFVTGTVAMETAVQRYLIVALIAWVGLSLLEALIGPTVLVPQAETEQAEPDRQPGTPPRS